MNGQPVYDKNWWRGGPFSPYEISRQLGIGPPDVSWLLKRVKLQPTGIRTVKFQGATVEIPLYSWEQVEELRQSDAFKQLKEIRARGGKRPKA